VYGVNVHTRLGQRWTRLVDVLAVCIAVAGQQLRLDRLGHQGVHVATHTAKHVGDVVQCQ
jgi:hypothetical protein